MAHCNRTRNSTDKIAVDQHIIATDYQDDIKILTPEQVVATA